jgi:hypothetical protein
VSEFRVLNPNVAAGSARAPAEPGLVFADDFREPHPDDGPATESRYVSEGKLHLKPAASQSLVRLYTEKLRRDAKLDLSVNLKQNAGPTRVPAGIVFWARDLQNYYSALMMSDGRAIISRKIDGKDEILAAISRPNAAAVGLEEPSQLLIRIIDAKASFYLNDRLITSIDGEPPQEYKFGVEAFSFKELCHWTFSEFRVRAVSSAP